LRRTCTLHHPIITNNSSIIIIIKDRPLLVLLQLGRRLPMLSIMARYIQRQIVPCDGNWNGHHRLVRNHLVRGRRPVGTDTIHRPDDETSLHIVKRSILPTTAATSDVTRARRRRPTITVMLLPPAESLPLDHHSYHNCHNRPNHNHIYNHRHRHRLLLLLL
jgi:hypothetical protein